MGIGEVERKEGRAEIPFEKERLGLRLLGGRSDIGEEGDLTIIVGARRTGGGLCSAAWTVGVVEQYRSSSSTRALTRLVGSGMRSEGREEATEVKTREREEELEESMGRGLEEDQGRGESGGRMRVVCI